MAAKKTKKTESVIAEDLDIVLDDDSIELDDVTEVEPEDEEEIVVAEAPKPKRKRVAVTTDDRLPDVEVSMIEDEPSSGLEIVDIDANLDWITTLLYGKHGTGKTTTGATIDGALIAAIEDGTLSARKTPNKVKKVDCSTWDKIETLYWILAKGKVIDGKGIEIKTPAGKFLVTTLVFDTITKLIQVCLRSVVLGEKGAATIGKDVVAPTLRDWGTMTQKISYWLMLFDELPIHKVWLVQETSTGEAEDDEFSIYPDVNKALKSFLMAQADIIGRTCIIKHDGEMKYALKFGANNRYVTKDRTGNLGSGTYVNPKLEKLFAKALSE